LNILGDLRHYLNGATMKNTYGKKRTGDRERQGETGVLGGGLLEHVLEEPKKIDQSGGIA